MNRKAQSAMEYLMTYGWAILIIAIVLAALFQLGVFNPMSFAPKAPPGACQVFRPNGPGTTQFINLEGICTGEIPQYVASFNGTSGSIFVTGLDISQGSITISGWIYVSGFTNGNGDQEWWTDQLGAGAIGLQSYPQPSYPGATSTTLTDFLHNATNNGYGGCNDGVTNLKQWYFVTETVNGATATLYVDGQKTSCTYTYTNPGLETVLTIGAYSLGNGPGGVMDGNLANIQIYNTSLSANDVQALYLEGIGGAPIDLQHLVGWWPLNGNANDYSGNGNNGVPSGVTFVSNWYTGYTPP
jgi:hypothetical protein